MSPANKHKVTSAEETVQMEDKQDLSWKSVMPSSMDDDILLPGSSKLHASTSERTTLSEPRTDRSGSNVTGKASGREKLWIFVSHTIFLAELVTDDHFL